jgi:tRNA threonylcarbamoyladenosine biosynthesis protein TsaE
MVAADLPSAAVTARFARGLATVVRAPMVITLSGELGTGKTTVVRHVLRAMGVRDAVASPSFTLAQSYRERGGTRLHHLDLYRLAPGDDVALFAWDDYLGADAVVFVEWPEAGAEELPPADVGLRLYHTGRTARRAEAMAAPALESELFAALKAAGVSARRVREPS